MIAMNWHRMVLLLISLHFLCDFPWQGDFLTRCKRGVIDGYPWWSGMTAHAAIHAGAVCLLTSSSPLWIAEFSAHFLIDWMKCHEYINAVEDQLLHITCKVIWTSIFFYVR